LPAGSEIDNRSTEQRAEQMIPFDSIDSVESPR